MSISNTIEEYLSKHSVAYDMFSHEPTDSLAQAVSNLRIPKSCFARAVVLTDGNHYLMVVLPLSHIIDFAALKKITGRNLELVPAQFLSGLFPDCEEGSIPPLGEPYGIDIIYDDSLYELEAVVFEAGNRGTLIRIYIDDFKKLTEASTKEKLSKPELALGKITQTKGSASAVDVAGMDNAVHDLTPEHEVVRRLKDIYELPTLPEHAGKILEIRDNPNANIGDLAKLVELDPSLAVQVLRYATSPFFGYRGEINSIQEAISQVLGFDMVMNLALGLAALKPFRNPPDGPLGLDASWQHATFSAALARDLSSKIPKEKRPEPGMIYLAGLLHNFGFLLYGHLFQPEFYLLNKMIETNPSIPVTELEKQVLGMGQAKDVLGLGHDKVGSILMEFWNMPESIITVTREHHNENYKGPYEVAVKLMLITDRLLKRYDIGEACSTELPAKILGLLDLEEEQILSITEEFMENCLGADSPVGVSVA